MKHCCDCKNKSSRTICYGESRCAYCREMEGFEPKDPPTRGNTPESIQFLKEGAEDEE